MVNTLLKGLKMEKWVVTTEIVQGISCGRCAFIHTEGCCKTICPTPGIYKLIKVEPFNKKLNPKQANECISGGECYKGKYCQCVGCLKYDA